MVVINGDDRGNRWMVVTGPFLLIESAGAPAGHSGILKLQRAMGYLMMTLLQQAPRTFVFWRGGPERADIPLHRIRMLVCHLLPLQEPAFAVSQNKLASNWQRQCGDTYYYETSAPVRLVPWLLSQQLRHSQRSFTLCRAPYIDTTTSDGLHVPPCAQCL